jgi:hypothetical protein
MPIQIRRAVSTSPDPGTAARAVFAALTMPDLALAIVYCAASYDRDTLGRALAELFGPDAPVIGCTTAGEITPAGYLAGSVTGVSLGGPRVVAHTERIDHLREGAVSSSEAAARAALAGMRERGDAASAAGCFGFLLCDGMSMQEEVVAATLHANLSGIQVAGGSAADGLRFGATHLYHRGQFHTDCALLTLVSTPAAFKVFKTEHFVPSSGKMVITGAEPARRLVTGINGEPAALAYARALGVQVDELHTMVLAAHPVVVTVGGNLYVRSVQKVNDDGSLTFFCAIDEGIELTAARGVDLVKNLEDAFAGIQRELGPPALVLGCDCIQRSLEIGRRGCREQVAAILMANNVIGFATYGEQFNGLHVNQTFTGVAISAR